MKTEEKRKVIEVLLCGSSSQHSTLSDADTYIGNQTSVAYLEALHQRALIPSGEYHTLNLEAAYRLIESSPTLRREWFGR